MLRGPPPSVSGEKSAARSAGIAAEPDALVPGVTLPVALATTVTLPVTDADARATGVVDVGEVFADGAVAGDAASSQLVRMRAAATRVRPRDFMVSSLAWDLRRASRLG